MGVHTAPLLVFFGRAADWPKEHIWVGELRVVSKGEIAYIRLISEGGKLFAEAPVKPDAKSPLEKGTLPPHSKTPSC